MADNLITIKKIRTGAGEHLIDATYLGGHTFEEIQGMVHGVVDTYVIPVSNKSVDGYVAVVNATESTIETTKDILDKLVKKPNVSGYKLGDVILMEALSADSDKDEKAFDRWVSGVSEDGKTITLSILETQVAKHHHTISAQTSNAITSVTADSYIVVPTVGESVENILTAADAITEIVTSVGYSENPDSDGGHTLAVVDATSTEEGASGHAHTISAHSHNASFSTDDFSEEVEVYTSSTVSTHSTHTHDSATVAGVATDASEFTYVKDGDEGSFVKSLTDSSETTSVATVTASSIELTTEVQTIEDKIGEVEGVNTKESGEHTHEVNGETESDVITSVSLAEQVLTDVSLNYTAPSVQASVVTSVSYTPVSVVSSVGTDAANFLNSLSVDEDGVLSFSSASAVTSVTPTNTDVIETITVSSDSQSAGSASLTLSSVAQSFVSAKVSVKGTAVAAGSHSHGFSHTHTIASHTHTIGEHSHTYEKPIIGDEDTANAIISLTKASYKPHTHESATVAGVASTGETISYLTGGSKTKVKVISSAVSTVSVSIENSSELTTDTKYYKLTGDIEFPGLSIGKVSISKASVTPAVAGTDDTKAIKSITTTSASFVTNVDENTSVNIGGEVE